MAKICSIVFILLILPQISFCTSLAPQHIDSLYAKADFVGIVEIRSGEVGSEGWAIYTAHVLNAFKGEKDSSEIVFGMFRGYAVGSKYLLFLSKSDSNVSFHLQTWIKNVRVNYDMTKSFYLIMFDGFGSLDIDHTISLEPHGEGIKVSCKYIILPEQVLTTKISSAEARLWDYRWVRMEDLILYLRQIQTLPKN